MQSRGFTLLEMVLVLAVVSILLAIATLNFRDYARRYRTEAQTRLLYGELLKARVSAICQRRTVRVKLYPDRFEVYSSQLDNESGVQPALARRFEYPVTCTAKRGSDAKGYPLDFQMQGTTFDNCSICLEPNAGSGAVDSIKVSTTRLSIGKKDRGEACQDDNITTK